MGGRWPTDKSVCRTSEESLLGLFFLHLLGLHGDADLELGFFAKVFGESGGVVPGGFVGGVDDDFAAHGGHGGGLGDVEVFEDCLL